MTTPAAPRAYRFGEYELDVAAYELRREGRRVRLERRPMDLLILMVERRGELITRGEIAQRLWGDDVFIELENAVNTLIRKIRQALRDSPDAPRFVETVPGKGYRFTALVEPVASAAAAATHGIPTEGDATPKPSKRASRTLPVALLAVVLAATLGAVAWFAARPSHVKLAVLPFEPINLGAELAYLPDALHDETIAALGQVDPEYIEVITRTSMLPYRNTPKSPALIAQELDVAYLVHSSIHAERGRIVVRARLIRARDQVEIWNGTYDYAPRSVLAFQRDLSFRIADEIRRRVSPARLETLARRYTDNDEAYRLYLQGLSAWNQLTPETTRRAIGFYTRATQLDPGFALPWAGIALAHAGAPINADADPRQMAPLARWSAEQAIAAAPRLAEAMTASGAVKFWFERDWPAAETLFRGAVAADPNYAFGQRMVGILLAHKGQHDEAREQMRRLLRLEPAYAMNYALRAQVAYNAREYATALEFANQAREFQPGFWIAGYQLAQAYEQSGETDRALQAIDTYLTPASNSKLHSLRGYILARTGRTADARAVLNTLDLLSRERYVPSYARALVYAGLGDRQAAFEWLQRAYEEGDVHLIALPTDAKWNSFRQDPRFVELLARCGFSKRGS